MSELGLAWRRLRRAPAFSVTAVLTLSLALGANVATFAIVDGLLFRPLPYWQADDLLSLRAIIPNGNQAVHGAAVIAGAASTRVAGIAGVTGSLSLAPPGPAEATWRALEVTDNALEVLGVQPALGRSFVPGDGHRSGVGAAMISYGAWQRRFGSEPGVIGHILTTEQASFEIVGVLPEGFFLPYVVVDPTFDLVVADRSFLPDAQPDFRYLLPFVRLTSEASRESLQAELDGRLASFWSSRPASERGRVEVIPIREAIFADWRPTAFLLLAASMLVMFLAIINLVALMLARGLGRARELAVRRALGARAIHVLRHLAAEALLLTAAAGLGALAMSGLTSGTILELLPRALAVLVPGQLDGRAFGFLGVMVLVAMPLLTLAGASRSMRGDLRAAIAASAARSGAGRAGRAPGRLLVATETALGVTALILGFSAIAVLVRLASQPLGYEPQALRAVRVTGGDAALISSMTDTSLAALRAHHTDIEASDCDLFSFRCDDVRGVTAGYLKLIGAQILLGRDLSPDDVAGRTRVAVVTESLAAARWPGQSPIGQRLQPSESAGFEVVGLIADIRRRRVEPRLQVAFVPLGARQAEPLGLRDRPGLTVYTRHDDGGALAKKVGEVVRTAIPDARVTAVAVRDFEIVTPRMLAVLFGVFGALGLLVSATGILGLQAATVAARRAEIAIRIAIGGAPTRVARHFATAAMQPVGAGVATGLLLVWWVRAAVAPLLPDGAPLQVSVRLCAGAASVLMLVALVSALAPAWRASRRDPLTELRAE